MEWLFCWGEERISARAVRDAALLEERWISDRSVGTGMCWRRSGSQIEPLELGLLEEKWGPDRAVVPAVWGEETWILGRGVRAVVSLKEKWISDGAAVSAGGEVDPRQCGWDGCLLEGHGYKWRVRSYMLLPELIGAVGGC